MLLLIAASVLLRSGLFLAVACICLGFYWLSRHHIPRFTVWLFLGGILVRFVVIWVLHPPLESDFEKLYDAAQSLLAGDLSFNSTPYFFPLGLSDRVCLLGSHVACHLESSHFFLEIVHAFLSAGTVCFLYRLVLPSCPAIFGPADGLTSDSFPLCCTLTTVLTNQIASAFFLVLGIWLLYCLDTDRLRFWRYPLCGVALQMGNLLRPEGVIVLVAVLAWVFFSALREPNRLKRLLCGFLAVAVAYHAFGLGADWLTKSNRIKSQGLAKFLSWLEVCVWPESRDQRYVCRKGLGPAGGTLDENFMPTPRQNSCRRS